MEEKMTHRIERQFAGRRLALESGRLARLAHGSCLVQFGETVVLVAATAQDKPTTLPFFPLTVEYREKSYAAGKIPGGFFKREGAPQEKEILSARLTDRSLRPMFPDGYFHETQVHAQILSADQENDADVLALVGASVALNSSAIPFRTPVAAVRIGRIQGNWVVNPTFRQLEYADVDIVVAGSAKAITMVEGGAVEASEADVLEGLGVAHGAIQELIGIQNELIALRQEPEMAWEPKAGVDPGLRERIETMAGQGVANAVRVADKRERMAALATVAEDVAAQLAEQDPGADETAQAVREVVRGLEKRCVRARILDEGVRADGRGLDEVRPISCEAGVLPRTHGSALFTRGQTQSLGVVTLGTSRDEQRIDSIDSAEQITKSFMLHYNFPPFSVGEARPIRATSRREKGHGALAERAIRPLLPDGDDFPYTIRIVSDILESNGSSSMASVCSASLSLMDAGVPLRTACAGVAMGLVAAEDGRSAVLTDILGLEDALGDMDFKVAGTRKGVTAIQMDIKIEGLTVEVLADALERARKGRMHILDEMDAVLASPRSALSPHAPRITTIRVNPQKIGDIIGPKGKNIRAIQDDTGATIEVEDDGTVKVAAVSQEASDRAREIIEAIAQDPEVGRIYEGPVKNTTTFGAFVEIMPGVEGLCHISELADERVGKTEDVVNRGDVVRVKLLSIDEKGRMRLSMKAAAWEEARAAGGVGSQA